jgi:hypothetical protein
MRRIIGALAAVAVLVGGGCATTDAERATTTDSPAATATEPATPPAQPVDTPEPAPDPGIAAVGPDEWFTYEDGLEVQVTGVESMTLGQNAFTGSPGDPGAIVTVTIKNGTPGVFDASLADVLVTYGPNGDPTEREYDEVGFTGSLPPGEVGTAQYDFGVIPLEMQSDLLIEVIPSFEHESSFFEGAAS